MADIYKQIVIPCAERQTSARLIARGLSEWPQWAAQDARACMEQVLQIERGCHNATIDICNVEGYCKRFDSQMFLITYSSLINKILSNFEVAIDNGRLIDNIIGGVLDAQSLATMTTEELCPHANKEIRDDIELRKRQKIEKNVSLLYTCSKCRHNRTTVEIVQTRALDEGTTKKITCSNCGFRW